MRFLFKLPIVAAVAVACFRINWMLGYFAIIGGILFLAVTSGNKDEEGIEDDHHAFPSTIARSDVSAAWLGAKLDEADEVKRQNEREGRVSGP